MLDLDLTRRRILQLVGGLAAIAALLLLGTFVGRVLPADRHWLLDEVLAQLSLTAENRVAVWYSAMLLLTVALAMIGCHALDRREPADMRDRLLDLGWVFCAFAFALLSLDEAGSLHERLSFSTLPRVDGLRGWTTFLMVPIAIVGTLFAGFAWLRMRRSPAAAALMLLGVLCFLTIPVQEHLEVGHLERGELRPDWQAVVEEGTELLGTLCFLSAALLYMRARTPASPDGTRRAVFRPAPAEALGVVGLLAAGFAPAMLLAPELVDLDDGRGLPQNWFAAVAACLTTLLAVMLAARARADAAVAAGRALLLLGVMQLVLSADHGSAHHLSEEFLVHNDTRRLQVDVMLVVALLATAGAVVATVPHPLVRGAVVLWAVLQLLAFVPGTPPRVVLAFAAHVQLLLALVRFARARAADTLSDLARPGALARRIAS